jgi:hypothetical protein
MVEVADLFTTNVGTSKQFLKVVHGLAQLIHERLLLGESCKRFLQVELRLVLCTYPGYNAVIVNDEIRKNQSFSRLENNLKDVLDVVKPTYTGGSQPNPPFLGANISFIDNGWVCIDIRPKDTYAYFPTARERLETRRYIALALQDLQVGEEVYRYFSSLLSLPSL